MTNSNSRGVCVVGTPVNSGPKGRVRVTLRSRRSLSYEPSDEKVGSQATKSCRKRSRYVFNDGMPAKLLRLAALPLAILFIVLSPATALAEQYVVRPGDSLWSISHQAGVSLQKLLQANSVANPDLIYPGQTLTLPGPATAPAVPAPASHPMTNTLDPNTARAILITAADHHGVRPSFILAVSWWESGWNPNIVSRDGAIGMMQVLPTTATWAGPSLLGRKVDLHNPTDNAEVGAALLHRYLVEFGDPKLALGAYYQGEAGTRKYGIYPSSHTYVDGIWALRNRFELSA